MKNYKLVPVLLACLFAALAVPRAWAAKTIYFVNNASWSTQYAYVWKENPQEIEQKWPGTVFSTKYSRAFEGKTVYTYTVNDDKYDKIIFNNGGSGDVNQTGTLDLKDGALYIVNKNGNTISCDIKESWGVVLSHTAYLVNDANWSPVKAHIWGTDGGTTWPGEALTLADTGEKYNGKTVYSFTFSAGYTPKNIIFNNGSQTDDLTYADNNLYILGSGTHTTDNNTRQDCETKASGSYEFDKVVEEPVWPVLAIRGSFTGTNWAWNEKYIGTEEKGVYTWSFPGGLAGNIAQNEFKIADEGYTIDYSSQVKNMMRNTKYTCKKKVAGDTGTDNMALGELISTAVTIRLDLTVDPPTIEFIADEAVNPEAPRRVYMSFGQERIYEGNTNVKPRVMLLDKVQTSGISVTVNDFNNAIEMTKAFPEEPNLPMWYIDLTEEQYCSTKDMAFLFQPADFDENNLTAKGYRQYIAGRADNRDAGNWTRYIYFADGGKAAQSYMTIEQYKAAKAAEKEHLYVVGKGFTGLKGWELVPAVANWDNINTLEDLPAAACLTIDKKDNAFYQNVLFAGEDNCELSKPSDNSTNGQKTQKGAGFKMSWIRPVEYYLLSGKSGGKMDSQRAWATFNLGIVGFRKLDPNVVSGSLPVITGDNGTNVDVYCSPCRTLPANNYNQSNWFIREQYMKTDANDANKKYTLIVGLSEDQTEIQTVTLLPFEPNPTISTATVTMTPMTLTTAQAEAIRAKTGVGTLSAEEASGKVLFTTVNVASARAKVDAPNSDSYSGSYDLVDGSKMNYQFEVEYEIYSNGELAGIYKGNPGDILVNGITLGSDATISVRARYTDKTSYNGKEPSNLTFHSRQAGTSVSAVTLPEITGVNVVKQSFTNGRNFLDDADQSNHRYTLGAYAEVEITAPENTDYVWYADFRMEPVGASYHDEHPEYANGGEVVHANHIAATQNKLPYLDGFTPWETGEYTDGNNWAAKMGKGGATTWYLYLPEVVEVKRTYNGDNSFTESEPAVKLNCQAQAVYPFLIDRNQSISVAPAQQAQAAPVRLKKAGSALDNTPDYVVTLTTTPVATASIDLGKQELTGVSDVLAPAADAGVEYYNLQGVRMHGELAPGLYIRRQGTEATKVMIR